MDAYLDTVRHVLQHGTRKPNRTGVDTLSAFNVNQSFDLDGGFPLLTTKRINWKNIIVENLWFLSGNRSIAILRKHGCRFWDPWAGEDGLVPSAYGFFWRQFPKTEDEDGPADQAGEADKAGNATRRGDQIEWAIEELRRNPMSRRLVVSAWAPTQAQRSRLPPCHYTFVLNVQHDRNGERRLNLHLTMRSCDVAIGLPYNIAGYSLLLALFAAWTGLKPGAFAYTLVDAHVYTKKEDGSMAEHDHVPGLEEQLARAPRPLPRLELSEKVRTMEGLHELIEADPETEELLRHFSIHDYAPHPPIRFKVAV